MSTPWYADGLRFTCTRCGKCCTGEPGFVWVNDEEVQAIAERLELSLEEVQGRFTRMLHGRRTLKEKLNNDCIFYDSESGCTIYEIRPRQCRTWPFWESNLKSQETWDRTEQVCPGSGEGELIPLEEITRRLKVIRI
jgi:Fe-S-cluster containining protein